jgi:hypothetical protein
MHKTRTGAVFATLPQRFSVIHQSVFVSLEIALSQGSIVFHKQTLFFQAFLSGVLRLLADSSRLR